MWLYGKQHIRIGDEGHNEEPNRANEISDELVYEEEYTIEEKFEYKEDSVSRQLFCQMICTYRHIQATLHPHILHLHHRLFRRKTVKREKKGGEGDMRDSCILMTKKIHCLRFERVFDSIINRTHSCSYSMISQTLTLRLLLYYSHYLMEYSECNKLYQMMVQYRPRLALCWAIACNIERCNEVKRFLRKCCIGQLNLLQDHTSEHRVSTLSYLLATIWLQHRQNACPRKLTWRFYYEY